MGTRQLVVLKSGVQFPSLTLTGNCLLVGDSLHLLSFTGMSEGITSSSILEFPANSRSSLSLRHGQAKQPVLATRSKAGSHMARSVTVMHILLCCDHCKGEMVRLHPGNLSFHRSSVRIPCKTRRSDGKCGNTRMSRLRLDSTVDEFYEEMWVMWCVGAGESIAF